MRTAPAPVLEITATQRTSVRRRCAAATSPPRAPTVEMVKAAALRQDVAAIARWSRRRPETSLASAGRLQDGGIAALADAPRQGRPAKADAAYLISVEATRLPTRRHDRWGSRSMALGLATSAYLAQQTGVRIAPGHALAPAALRLRPTQTHACPSPRPGRVPCLPRSSAAGGGRCAQPERYELHYQDETHLDTNPYLSRIWHRGGKQPTVPAAGPIGV